MATIKWIKINILLIMLVNMYIFASYIRCEILSMNGMMREITVEDVRIFLNSLNVKLDVYGMVFADRKRCQETMRMLGINEIVAKNIVRSLDATNFSKYFDDASQWGCDLWAFGKDIKGEEVYIKIGLGLPDRQTICVSFHKADFPIQYPFK